jgi:hypothetical protein
MLTSSELPVTAVKKIGGGVAVMGPGLEVLVVRVFVAVAPHPSAAVSFSGKPLHAWRLKATLQPGIST